MVFSSILFIFRFLPMALILYYLTPYKYKNLVLTILSLVFYSWGEGKYFLIMIASIAVDYSAGKLIYKFSGEKKKKLFVLCVSLIFNLGLLFFFKYINFFIDNLNNIFSLTINRVNITLPLGISFYTFQTMSYSIDVYRRRVKPENNIINFAAFVTLFPQLIAGPIVKYTDISEEIKSRTITRDKVEEGIQQFILGLGSKVLIANNIGMLWTEVENIGFNNISTPLAWLGALAFGLQIYFDFSGYSLMAIGLGKMLGFTFPQNFNYPYISRSISEFWRRWHITLGSWFKEYVYIPLGGNRRSKLRVTFNLFVVWALTGFWHGASYNFILWGLFFFVLISLEKLGLSKVLEKHKVFSHLYTIFFLIIGWILFAITDLKNIGIYLRKMFIYTSGSQWLYYIRNYGVSIIIAVMFSMPFIPNKYKKLKNKRWIQTIILMIILLISIAYLVDATYNPFLYFRF